MEEDSIIELIFVLVLIGGSMLAVFVQKAAAKRTREQMQKKEGQRRRYAPSMRQQTPYQYGPPKQQQPPAMTREHTYAQQATERYQEAVIQEVSPEEAIARQAGKRYQQAAVPEVSPETPPLRGTEPLGEALRGLSDTLLATEAARVEGVKAPAAPGVAKFLESNVRYAILMGEIFGPPLADRPPKW